MLKSITAALTLSTIREKLNDLNAVTDPTDAQKTEERDLLASQKTAETEYREALTAEGDERTTQTSDAETRERLQLVSRASLGAIFARAVEHRSTEGAESELQAALALAPNQVPIDLLRAPVEERAITPAPTHVGASEQAVLMPIFADGDAAFLNVDQVTVPNGDAVFPVLTNRPTVGGPHADSTEVTETTGAFSAELVKPERLQCAFTYRRTDAARFSAMGEALRAALNEALSESLDVQIVSGADGLLGGTNLDAHGQAAVDTFGTYVSKFGFARVDGRYAPTAKSIKVLMGSAGYAHAGSVYRGDQSQESAVDRLMTITGGVRVSAHVTAVASTKQQTIVRLGARRDAVAGLWQGVTIIPDEITRAKQGEIVITAVLLAAVKNPPGRGILQSRSQGGVDAAASAGGSGLRCGRQG